MTREIVRQDVELLGMLPENSEAKKLLSKHIDATVRKIVEGEDQRTREYVGSCLAVGVLRVAVFLLAVCMARGGWWGAFRLFSSVSGRRWDGAGRRASTARCTWKAVEDS
ncbi:hypothetical protein [Streptomyces sp. NPDC001642]|uniref:hypothetical protein n=1 Tax=Streptomyces sp. NPDC001642 TaxID=3154392 RepID=UPI00331E700F